MQARDQKIAGSPDLSGVEMKAFRKYPDRQTVQAPTSFLLERLLDLDLAYLANAIASSYPNGPGGKASGSIAHHAIKMYCPEPERSKVLTALAIVQAECWDDESVQFRTDLKALLDVGDRSAVIDFLSKRVYTFGDVGDL